MAKTAKPTLPRPVYADVLLQLGFWRERLERRGAYQSVADDIREWLQQYDFTAQHDYRIAVELLGCWKYLMYIDDIGQYYIHHGILRKKLIQMTGAEEMMTRFALDHMKKAIEQTQRLIELISP